MLGPLRPTIRVLTMLQTQQLDMIKMYYVGPFLPMAESGSRYTLILVDYCRRSLFAERIYTAMAANSQAILEKGVFEVRMSRTTE